jgi:hypothetical protein
MELAANNELKYVQEIRCSADGRSSRNLLGGNEKNHKKLQIASLHTEK